MKRHLTIAWLFLLLASGSGTVFMAGCGDKIALPVAEGLFGNYRYRVESGKTWDQPIQDMVVSLGRIYVLQSDNLTKYTSTLAEALYVVSDFGDATAMAVDEGTGLVFVWDDADKFVRWYDAGTLAAVGSAQLPDVQTAVAVTLNDEGIDQLPGASTFLYLSDTESLVVHRYAYDEFNGLIPFGILARADGDAARFVHIPAAMATDIENKLLICDQDLNRNWVIRFDGTPDTTDISTVPNVPDGLRGTAVVFEDYGCITDPASYFVIGNAALCQDPNWEGGVSDLDGEFNVPAGIAVDGLGRIFVADHFNSRIQVFSRIGEWEPEKLKIGLPEDIPHPTAIGVYDVHYGSSAGDVNYAAFVYVLVPELNRIVVYISKEHEALSNVDFPPELQ